MKKILLILGMVAFLAGCAAVKQGIDDYKLGSQTPLVNGEISPSEKAHQISDTVSGLPIPFAPAAGTALATILGVFFTWQRGSQIRKNGAPSATQATNVPHIVQDIANVVAGAFTIANNNASTATSVVQRVWKVALALGISGGAVAAADPSVMTFLASHPVASAAFVGITSALAGLEKGLSNVPAPAQPTNA